MCEQSVLNYFCGQFVLFSVLSVPHMQVKYRKALTKTYFGCELAIGSETLVRPHHEMNLKKKKKWHCFHPLFSSKLLESLVSRAAMFSHTSRVQGSVLRIHPEWKRS